MTNETVVEWAPIELADGIDEAQFIEASTKFQKDFLAHQEGFIRRDLLRDNNGGLIDLVCWENATASQKVLQEAEKSEACYAYFSVMKGADSADPSMGIQHFNCIQTYHSSENS